MRWFESSRPRIGPSAGAAAMNAALRGALDAFARGDLPAALEHFAADATYREARRPAVAGREAIGALFERWSDAAVPWRFMVDEVIEADERACVVYRFAVREGEDRPWRERAGCALVRFGERSLIAEWREYEG